MTQELYACLFAKEMPAQAILRLRPELGERPCVVMEGEPPLQTACALNKKARLLGLAHGMTRVEVDTFPAAAILPRSRAMEDSARSILLECAGTFSPRVEDRSTDTSFLCAIDIAGTRNLFGAPQELAEKLLDRVAKVGIQARIAVSSNLHTAACVVRGMSARQAIQVVPSGEEAAAMSGLPLGVLDLTETQTETFALWGIKSPGMLAALPAKSLISRMGNQGGRLHQMARGELPHLFQPVEPPLVLREKIELDSAVEHLESLLFGVNVMLEQLILRAQSRILVLASVRITLRLEDGSTCARTVRPALPANDKQLWLKLLQLDLDAHPPQAGIIGVELKAEPGRISKVQLGLFSPQMPESSRLDVTLARIRAIVGEDNVGQAVLEDTHAPRAFRMQPFRLPACDSAEAAATQPRAAMRQLRPPQTTSVTLRGNQPEAFLFHGRRYNVEYAYGPWKTGGDWWNQTLWGLEQWDLVARATDGSTLSCCLVRDLMQNQWQVASLYD